MLTPNDREDLRWAMQASLLEQTKVLQESSKENMKSYILNEATYEQMLNLCFNPYPSDEVYMESEELEVVAKSVIYEMTIDDSEVLQESLETINGKYNLLESIVQEVSGEQWGSAAGKKTLGRGGKAKIHAQRYAEKAKEKLKDAGEKIKGMDNKKKAGLAAAGVAAAAGAYYIYRKMRKAGKDKKQAAQAAAAAAKSPEEKAKWNAKVKQYS
jgi:hypothetical protein